MTPIISTTKRTRRPIDGVLLLDKPVGPSSSRVLGHVKHLLKAAKAGHGGTLDPMASGLLPLMFGESTKYAAEGLDADKTYIAEIALGEKTSTGDREGETILRMPVPSDLSEEKLHAVLRAFQGPQTQIPPMFSALKKDGRALYDYARAGEEVDRPARKITIHAIKLLGWTLPNLIVRVVCSKGTYIRTLAEDIGAAMGLPAHLHGLRRVGVGQIEDDGIVSLDSLEQANDEERLSFLKPVDWLIRDWPQIILGPSQVKRFQHGQSVMVSQELTPDVYRVNAQTGEFLGTGRVESHHMLNPERVRVLSS